MNGLIWLSDSQKSVLHWLEALPGAESVTIRCREVQIPGRERRTSQEIEITGGAELGDLACESCGHTDWKRHVSATFEWKNGKFKEATIYCGHRSHVRSLKDAKEKVEALVRRAQETEQAAEE